MSHTTKIYVYEESFPEIEVVSGDDKSIQVYGEESVITIFEPGAQGPIGPQGPAGFSGAGEPFYVIQSGSLYATTASLAILAYFSSSLIPITSSLSYNTFDLGSQNHSWRSLYVSESINIIKSGSILIQLKGSENTLEVGQSKISTSSFGFDNYILKRIASNQQTLLIQSASISHSINEEGVFSIGDFINTPTPIPGGIIKSGSDFYFGI